MRCWPRSTDGWLRLPGMPDPRGAFARYRIQLGFAFGFGVLWFVRPTCPALAAGAVVATAGELLRLWAAGHLEKGREVTRSGPYRLLRHPLYVGSVLLGIGLAIASTSVPAAALIGVYLGVTIPAAIRHEEATLSERFGGDYDAYRAGTLSSVRRGFSLRRAIANNEHRAALGLMAAMAVLALKARCWFH